MWRGSTEMSSVPEWPISPNRYSGNRSTVTHTSFTEMGDPNTCAVSAVSAVASCIVEFLAVVRGSLSNIRHEEYGHIMTLVAAMTVNFPQRRCAFHRLIPETLCALPENACTQESSNHYARHDRNFSRAAVPTPGIRTCGLFLPFAAQDDT